MKAYRIQARSSGTYIDHKLEAESDQDALNKFSEAVSQDKVKIIDEGFYSSMTYITFEEINYVATSTSVEEVRAGIELGQSSIKTG